MLPRPPRTLSLSPPAPPLPPNPSPCPCASPSTRPSPCPRSDRSCAEESLRLIEAFDPPFDEPAPEPELKPPRKALPLPVFDGPLDDEEEEEEEEEVCWVLRLYPPLPLPLPVEPSRERMTTSEASRHTCCSRYMIGPLVVPLLLALAVAVAVAVLVALLLLALVVLVAVLVALALVVVVVFVISPNSAGENSGPHPSSTDRGVFSSRYFNNEVRSSGWGRKTANPATNVSMAVMLMM